MKLISFSFNCWYYPFWMSVFHFFQTLTGSQLKMKNLILIPFLNSFSHLFGYIHEDINILYMKYISTKTILDPYVSLKHIITTSGFLSVNTKDKKTAPKASLFLILALGFVNSFSHSIFVIYTSFHSSGFGTIQSYLSLLSTIALCYIVFRTKIYRHHVLALVILTITIGIYIGCQETYFENFVLKNYTNWGTFIGILLLYIIPTSFREVIEKYLTQKYDYSSAFLLCTEASISLSIFIAIFIIVQYIPCQSLEVLAEICEKLNLKLFLNEAYYYFSYVSFNHTLILWAYVAMTYYANYYRVETIRKLSPPHRFIAEMLFYLYWFVMKCLGLQESDNLSIGLEVFQVVFLLIASCVFNEYIIIRVCNMHINTNDEITKRAINDPLSCVESFSTDSNSFIDREPLIPNHEIKG